MNVPTSDRCLLLSWIACLLLVTACSTGPPVREIDAKLIARNFLHGRRVVDVAAGVGQPDVPYRFMTDFRAVKETPGSAETASTGPVWKITVRVTEGPYHGRHEVRVHPEKKQIIGWSRPDDNRS